MIGAYILLWPRANIKTLVGFFVFFRSFNIPAVLIFAFWLFGQLSGFLNPQGNVAYDVHLYSMVAGMVLIPFFKRPHVKFFQKPLTRAFSRANEPLLCRVLADAKSRHRVALTRMTEKPLE